MPKLLPYKGLNKQGTGLEYYPTVYRIDTGNLETAISHKNVASVSSSYVEAIFVCARVFFFSTRFDISHSIWKASNFIDLGEIPKQ